MTAQLRKIIRASVAAAAALVLVAGASTAQATLLTGLVAYYPFDDGTATDYSGFGNNATGGAGTGFNSGHVGGGGAFSDGTGFFSVPWNAQNGLNGPHSTQIWINTTTTARSYLLGQSSGSPNHFPYHIELMTGGSVGRVNVLNDGFGDRIAPAGTEVNDGAWHHIVTTWNEDGGVSPATMQIWIDGEPAFTGTSVGSSANQTITDDASTAQAQNTPFRFGGTDQFTTGRPYTGQLDEVALWNRVLTEAEIVQLYNDGAGMAVPEPSSLALAGLGLAALALYRVRRRQA